MKTKSISLSFGLVMAWIFVTALDPRIAAGQEPDSAATAKEESQESASKRYLAVMRSFADTIRVTAGQGEKSLRRRS